MKRLWTPAWLVRHVLTVALVAAFLALGWWQISRAASGNTLSWAYAFEWPIFAGFVVFLWVREARHTRSGRRTPDAAPGLPDAESGLPDAAPGLPGAAPGLPGAAPVPAADQPTRPGIRRPVRSGRPRLAAGGADDPALAEYNHYLAWLNANPDVRPADYPGPGRH